jgi:hypothetical protein
VYELNIWRKEGVKGLIEGEIKNRMIGRERMYVRRRKKE